MSDFPPFRAEKRNMELATTQSRIKAWRRKRRLSRHFCPQCGQFREFGAGVFERRKKHRWRQLSRKARVTGLFKDVLQQKGGIE